MGYKWNHIYTCLILPQKILSQILRQKKKHRNKDWEQIVFITARRTLTRHWIKQTPTIGEVEKDIQQLFRLEKLELDSNNTSKASEQEKFKERWGY